MIRRVKGTRDILPPETRLWNEVERIALAILGGFGYTEIRLPLVEPTELFVRSVGEGTDIVAKEMYTFSDRKGRSLTLRPEGTASVARAYIENGLGQRPQPLRLSYFGPMFRYEKMQRGRYRQFSQIGIEILGAATPAADVEVITALHTFLAALGFDDLLIVLNNLGDPEDREVFIEGLKRELGPHKDSLCRDCQRRWDENPLRILDCKVEGCRALVAETTPVADVVSGEARAHVEEVEAGLLDLDIPVRRAPRLVRGLDYYLRTVFEVISPELGERTVICGGGRYDRLISDLGGAAVPGTGFAIGEDRLIEVLPTSFQERVLAASSVAILPVGDSVAASATSLARDLVRAGVVVETEVTGRSLKAGLKWASKIDAAVALILGERELAEGVVVIRDLVRGEQETVERGASVATVIRLLADGDR
jgi:histidyl-tRNA synthetase